MPKSKDNSLDSKINNALTGSNPEIALNSLIDEITNPNQKEKFTEESLNFLQGQLLKQIENSSHLNAEKKNELKHTVESKMKEKKDLLGKTSSELKQLAGGVNERNGNDDSAVESQEPSFWSKAGSFVSENWDAMFDKEKWRTETGKNALRVAGFLGTGVGVLKGLWEIGKWCGRKIKGWFSGEKELQNELKDIEKNISLLNSQLRTTADPQKIRDISDAIDKLNKRKNEITDKLPNNPSSNNDEGEKKEKPGFFGKVWNGIKWTLGIGAVGTAVGCVASDSFRGKVKDWFGNFQDWLRQLWRKETPEEGFGRAVSLFFNPDEYENIPQHLKCSYENGKVRAFGQEIEIDGDKIKGLDISFKSKADMFVAAFLIAYMQYIYSGHCENNMPFKYDKATGDIDVNITKEGLTEAISGSGSNGKWVGGGVGVVAGIITTIFGGGKAGIAVGSIATIIGLITGEYYEGNNFLNKNCESLDNESAKIKLANYLNKKGNWESGNQNEQQVAESKIRSEVIEVIREITRTQTALPQMGTERILNAIPEPGNPNKLLIKSYGQDGIEVTLDESNPAHKTLKIGTLDVEFPVKEGIYVANFLNKLQKDYIGENLLESDSDDDNNLVHNYFYYDTSSFRKNGIYANLDGSIDRCILEDNSKNNVEGKYQTLFKYKDKVLSYVNTWETSSGKPYWTSNEALDLQNPNNQLPQAA